MTAATLIRTGAVGAAGTALVGALPILALCCAATSATLALGAGVGVAGETLPLEWLWLIVLPLFGFLALLAYGLHRERPAGTTVACCGRQPGRGSDALPRAG